MTMASQIDINGRLILNKDQEEFRKLAETAVRKLTKKRTIDGKNKQVYADFVVTIEASMDRRTFSIYRNRTSVLVISEQNESVVSISFEYIYIEDHIKQLLENINGKGSRD